YPGETAGVGTPITTAVCNTGDASQTLVFTPATGLIVHTPTGLCVDAGSKVSWCDAHSGWAICNTSASIDARAADIVSRLSLADKILALNTDTHELPSVSPPAYNW